MLLHSPRFSEGEAVLGQCGRSPWERSAEHRPDEPCREVESLRGYGGPARDLVAQRIEQGGDVSALGFRGPNSGATPAPLISPLASMKTLVDERLSEVIAQVAHPDVVLLADIFLNLAIRLPHDVDAMYRDRSA
jgi:hypothetical protein